MDIWPTEKTRENAAQEKKQQEAENEHERTAQRNRCQAEQKRWSIVSASQIEIGDPSLTGIGNDDYNISAVVRNKSDSKVIGLRLSVTARDCPTQDAPVADCDIFGRVETFESDIPAGEVRQINRKITIRVQSRAMWSHQGLLLMAFVPHLNNRMTRQRMIFCRSGLGGASNNVSWMKLRETQRERFSLRNGAGLRSKRAAQGGPSNLRAGPFDNAQHRKRLIYSENVANALETARPRRDSARYQHMS